MNSTNSLLEEYSLHLKGMGRSDNTAASYFAAVKRFAAWHEGMTGEPFDPAAVTPLDVADYRRQLAEKGKRPATVNAALEALSSFFNWAAGRGLVQANPVEGVKRLKEQRQPPRWLSRRELGAFMRAVQKYGGPKEQALAALLLHTGLRVSEARSLRLEDVVIRDRSGHVVVRSGKGGKYREVPLNATVRRILVEYLAAHPGGEWLFPGGKSFRLLERPMTARAVEKMLVRFSRLAGIEPVTPHRLRHTFCKMLVDAGEGLDRVAELAGHESLNTTARYTRPGKADLEAAVEKLAWE